MSSVADAAGACGAAVDVVVVTHQSAATLGAALDAVRRAPRVNSILVVDNASCDDTRRVANEAGVTVVPNERNVGFAAGVNAGLPLCRSPYVLLLNPDAVLLPDDLDRLVRALQADKAAVAAGPMLVGESGRAIVGGRRFSTPLNRLFALAPVTRRWRHGRLGPEYPRGMAVSRQPATVDYLWGAALLLRRDFLARIGGLDGRFFLYSEDEDLGRAARALGARMLLVPTARAGHVGGVSSAGDEGIALARLGHALALGLEKWTSARQAALFRAGFRAVLVARVARDKLLADNASVAADARALRVFTRLCRGADPAGRFEG